MAKYLQCLECKAIFLREEGVHEAEMAWAFGVPSGDYVCPNCGVDDSLIDELGELSEAELDDSEL